MIESLLPEQLGAVSAVLLIGTSFLTSAISASFGLGGGVAMLIALLSLTPPMIALPVHALIQIGSNAGRCAMLRSHVIPGIVRWFIPGSIVGVILASLIFISLPVRMLQVLLAFFVIWSVWAPKFQAMKIQDRTFAVIGGIVTFSGMFLGATGPLLGAFLSPNRYGRDATVATHAMCMAIQHIIRVVAFGLIGFVLLEWIPLVVAMIASGLVGTYTGKMFLDKIPERQFRIMFRCVLTLLALRLLFNALSGQ